MSVRNSNTIRKKIISFSDKEIEINYKYDGLKDPPYTILNGSMEEFVSGDYYELSVEIQNGFIGQYKARLVNPFNVRSLPKRVGYTRYNSFAIRTDAYFIIDDADQVKEFKQDIEQFTTMETPYNFYSRYFASFSILGERWLRDNTCFNDQERILCSNGDNIAICVHNFLAERWPLKHINRIDISKIDFNDLF